MKREKTTNSPFVNLSEQDCKIEIKGSSFSEDVDELYKDVIKWINSKVPNLKCELNCEFYFTVINSITQKNLMQIFFLLSEFYKKGIKMNFIWTVDKDDEDILSLIEEISDVFDFPIKVIED